MTKHPLFLFLTLSSLLACTSVSTLGNGTDPDGDTGGASGDDGASGSSPTTGGASPHASGGTSSSSGGKGAAAGTTSMGGASAGKGSSSNAGTDDVPSDAGQPGAGTTSMPVAGNGGSGAESAGGMGATAGTDSMGGMGSSAGDTGCVNTLDTNQGNTPPAADECADIGEALKSAHDLALVSADLDVVPLAGTWLTGSGTSRIEIVLDALGKGTVRFGEASLFPEFSEGDETFLSTTGERDADGVLGLSHLKVQPGFAYSVLADSGRGSQMSFHVLVMEAWEEWCAAQTPIASPNSRNCYACLYDDGLYSFSSCGEEPGCYAGDHDLSEEKRVHCGRLELCVTPYHNVCNCDADECFTNLGVRNQLTEYPFTLELDPVDTTVLRLASHSELVDKVTYYLEKQ